MESNNNDNNINNTFPLWLVFHHKNGRAYYYNTVTGRSQWPAPSKDDLDLSNQQGREDPWRVFPNKKGALYYYNTTTGESQWVQPSEDQRQLLAAIPENKKATTSVMTADTPIQIGASSMSQSTAGSSHYFDAQSGNKQHFHHPNDRWVIVQDPNRNDYYVNTRTGESQWEKPPIPLGAATSNDDQSDTMFYDTLEATASSANLSHYSDHTSNNTRTSRFLVKKKEDDNEPKIDFLKDDKADMTFSRRLALYMMERYAWYNPKLVGKKGNSDKNYESVQQEDDDKDDDVFVDGHFRSQDMGHTVAVTPTDEDANLDEAWAHFEHVTLARYIVRDKQAEQNQTCFSRFMTKLGSCFKKGDSMDCAEPGENKYYTKLYHPFFTPHSQLGDFGIGCGVYFSTLRAFCFLTFLAGVLNIPTMMYYWNDYGAGRDDPTLPAQERASAVCMDHEWVLCDDCRASSSFPGDRVRFYNTTNPLTGEWDIPLVRLASRSNCNASTIQNGMINLATMFLIAIGILVINRLMTASEVAFDLDEQTAQDYSILIENPPPDSYSPEEWKQFFETNFKDVHVTCCTIGLDNDLLLQDMIERRELMKKLEMMVEPGTSLDMLTLAGVAAHVHQDRTGIANLMKNISPGIPELYAKIAAINARVKGLVQLDYPVTNVFITFETEKAQREVLNSLAVGKYQAYRNNTSAVAKDSYLFRGKHVLSVSEPDEPNTIRWKHLNANVVAKLKTEGMTAFATVIAIVCVAIVTEVINMASPGWAATVIAISNVLFPMVGKALVNFEEHASESDKQASLYWKIAIFRWVNTAVVFTLITPFNLTIAQDEGVVKRVRDLFFAEMTTSTVIQLFDIGGHVARHVSAPRGKTQDAMDLNMSGSTFDLAERYTNFTKMLFLALWYSSIYPTGFFMCCLSMFINYYVDRFSLMRTWKKPLNLGNEISTLNKKYFFPLCIFGIAFPSSFFWSGFPYDNLCEHGTIGERNDSTSLYLKMGPYGNGTIYNIPPHNYFVTEEEPELNITSYDITNDTIVYEHCFQNFLRTDDRNTFPFVSSNQKAGNVWMTEQQEFVTDVYGWTTLAVIVLIGLKFIYHIANSFKKFFVGTYKESGEDQNINFSTVESISTYIPQVNSSVYPYPLLASNIDNIDPELLEWNDDDRPHSFYDLTLDADALTAGLNQYDGNESDRVSRRGKVVFNEVAHWPPPDVKKNQ